MTDYVGGDMIRGHIDTIILNSLIDGDKDTNQIRSEIEARAGGQFQLKQGTFYSALQRIVKQGYVIEYRTTGADGVRRKFFQLTEKGKDHIDKNQSSWTMSRQVINTLLDTQNEKTVKQSIVVQQTDDELPDFDHSGVTNFSNLQNNAVEVEESIADQVISSVDGEYVESSTEEDSTTEEESVLTEIPPTFDPTEEISDATPQTFDDIMEMLERIDRTSREEEERKEQERIIAAEKAKAEEEERLIAEQVERERKERERNIPQVEIPDEYQIAEERSKKPTPLHDDDSSIKITPPVEPVEEKTAEQTENVTETVATVQPVVAEQISIITTDEELSNEPNDILNPDDLPTQKEYKEVLSRIFAADEEVENVIEFPPQTDQVAPPVLNTTTYIENTDEDDQTYDRIVDELDIAPIETPSKKEEKKVIENQRSKKAGAFDYSDIIELSEREGFKVNTSDRTNKSELGKILINRLNFHTSLIFFVLLALETLLVGLSMESVVKLGMEFYIYFSIAILAFPIIFGMIYYMAPKRTVAEVSTFKSAFETALIITLNLVLMILVYAVIIDLDFSSHQELTRNLFLPLLLVINVPIYVVIRYSLLEKQMYFS